MEQSKIIDTLEMYHPSWPIRPYLLPGVPGSTRYPPKHFRCPNTIVLYINLYLSTISRLLVMESAEWRRWQPVMVSPSGRVPKQGLNWFFMAIEACGGGTPDLGLFLGVYIFIGIFGIENKSGGSTSQRQDRGRTLGGVPHPPPLWMTRESSGPTLLLRGLLLVHTKSP